MKKIRPFYEFTNVTNSSAEILVYGDIVTEKPWWADNDDGFAAQNDFIRDLEALGLKEEITVRINSFGGEVFAATAMATHLKENSAKVVAKIDGVSASAATIISSAADVTQMVDNGIFMVHDPMLFLFGSYNEQELDGVQNALGAVKKAIVKGYKAKTGLSDDELSDIMSSETWMTAEEAKDMGFIDEILYDSSIEASISNDNKHIFYNSVDHDIAKFGFKDIPFNKIKNLAGKTTKAKTPTNGAKPNEKPENKPEGGKTVMTLEQLKKEHKEVYNQIVNETLAAERARMKGIDEIANTMSPEMVEEAKYTNYSTPQDLAFEALKVQGSQGQTFLNDMTDDLKPKNEAGDEGDDTTDDGTVVAVGQAPPAAEPKEATPEDTVKTKFKASVNSFDEKRRGLNHAKQ